MKRITAILAMVSALVLGCDDAPEIDLPPNDNESPSGGGDDQTDAMVRIAICDGAKDGTPCGDTASQTHCIFDACVKNVCGDGEPAFGEKCDDGNERDGDGCSSTCKLEVKPGCGNGVHEPGEDCDDGNTDNADACTATCSDPVCGDGVVSRGEQCDDGNAANGDSCTSRCKNAPVLCGNNVQDTDEECDDGNTTDGDGCEADCTLPPMCGDGDVEGDEECDDGNITDGDACQTDCTLPASGGTGGTGGGTGGTGSGTGGTGSGTGGTGSGTGGIGGGTGGMDDDVDGGAGGGGGDPGGCGACRDKNCISYQGGTNVVAGCFDATATGATARASRTAQVFTPLQVQTCVDAISCAEAMDCGHDPGRAGAGCYCGPLYPNNGDCAAAPNSGANAPNGVCKAQFLAAAAPLTSNQDILANLSSFDFPIGWVYRLLQCETALCDDSPDGDCTP